MLSRKCTFHDLCKKNAILYTCINIDTVKSVQIDQTDEFKQWLQRLKDSQSKARILKHLTKQQRAESLIGDWKVVDNALYEFRFTFGPGYRIYFTLIAQKLVILLIGGDKGSQSRDIEKAQVLNNEWRKQHGKHDRF